MSPHPRPILKRNWSRTTLQRLQIREPLPFSLCKDVQSPHVHFPPTPTLVSTHTADSPGTYDRRPIILSPACNTLSVCPSPTEFEIERTERGRSPYPKQVEEAVKGSYFHPRAFEACEPEDLDDALDLEQPPILLRDLSPDGDDADEVVTPPDPKLGAAVAPPHIAAPPIARLDPPLRRMFADNASLLYTTPSKIEGEQPRRPLVRMGKEPFLTRHEVILPEEGHGCLGGF